MVLEQCGWQPSPAVDIPLNTDRNSLQCEARIFAAHSQNCGDPEPRLERRGHSTNLGSSRLPEQVCPGDGDDTGMAQIAK